jgi:pimeloyl-ACP methyl ester carboxylesterase
MRTSAALAAALLACAACAAPRTRPGAREFTAADGARLVYDDRGDARGDLPDAGETAVVQVHCWCGDRAFWDAAVPEIAARYRVVAVDLAGHGESGRGRATWTVEGLADDVVDLIEALGLERVILVGHSMGGPLSLLAAPRLGGRLLGIVAVDTLHDVEHVWQAEMMEQWIASLAADWEPTMRQGVASMLPPGADRALAERIAAVACRTDRTAAVALIRDMFALDQAAALAACGVPVRAINAAAVLPIQIPTAVDTNRKYADFEAREMRGVGHYPMLERPAEFNALLMGELARLSAAAPAAGT